MPDLGSATYRLLVDAARMRSGLSQAQRDMNTFTGRMQGSMDRAGRSMQNFGRNMTLFVTAPLAAAAKRSTDVLAQFEETMYKTAGLAEIGVNRFDKQITGAKLDKKIAQVGDAAIKMGLDFGIGAREMAEGLYFISSAGFRAGDSMSVLKQVAQASASGLGEMEDVALAVAGAIKAYDLEAGAAAKITDTMSMAVRRGIVEADALAKVLGAVMGPARDAGVDFGEVAGAISMMTRSSMSAARSATSLRSILMRFQDPTEEVTEALKKMGLTAGDVRDMMEKSKTSFDFIKEAARSVPHASDEMKAGLGGLANTLLALKVVMDETGVRSAKLFDSIRAQPGFNAIIADVEGLNEVMGATSDAFRQRGEAANQSENAFDAMRRSLEFALDRLHAFWEAFQIGVGRILKPAVEDWANGFANIIDGFLKLDKASQDSIVRMGAAIAAIGPLAFIIGGLLRVSTLFIGGPLTLLIGGLAAVGTTIAAASIHSESFRGKVADLAESLHGAFSKGLKAIRDIWDDLGPKLMEAANNIMPKLSDFVKRAGGAFATAAREAKPFFLTLADFGGKVMPVVLDAAGALVTILGKILDLIGGGNLAKVLAWGAAWAIAAKTLRTLLGFNLAGRLKGLGALLAIPHLGRGRAAPLAATAALLRPGSTPNIIATDGKKIPMYAPDSRAGGTGLFDSRFSSAAQAAAYSNVGGLRAGLADHINYDPVTGQPIRTGQGRVASIPGVPVGAMGLPGRAPDTGFGRQPGLWGRMMERSGIGKSARSGFFKSAMASGYNLMSGQTSGLGASPMKDWVRSSAMMTKVPVMAKQIGSKMWTGVKTVGSGFASLLSPANLLLFAAMDFVQTLTSYQAHVERMKTITEDTASSLFEGTLSLSQRNADIANLQAGADTTAMNVVGELLSNPLGTLGYAFTGNKKLWEPGRQQEELDARLDPITGDIAKFGNKLAWSIKDAWTGIADLKFGTGSAPGVGFFGHRRPGELGSWLVEQGKEGKIDPETIDSVATLTAQYRGLSGSMDAFSVAALRVWLKAGQTDKAMSYLERDMGKLTKEFKAHIESVVTSKDVYKDWIDVLVEATSLNRYQRTDLAQVLDALQLQGVYLTENKEDLLESLIVTGDYERAQGLLVKQFSKAGDKVKGLWDILKHVPQNLRRKIYDAMKGITDPLDPSLKRNDLTKGNWVDKIFGSVDAAKFDPVKAGAVRQLIKMIDTVGIKLGKKKREAIRSAAQAGSWDEIINTLQGTLQGSNLGYENLMSWLEKNEGTAIALEFESNLEVVKGEIEDFYAKWTNTTFTVDMSIGAYKNSANSARTSGTGGGHGLTLHSGGPVGGAFRGDIPATLQEGEFVVRRSAAQTFRPLLEKINTYHDGGSVGRAGKLTFPGGTVDEAIGSRLKGAADYVRAYVQRAAESGGGGSLVALGKKLINEGYMVTGHSAFPPVGKHTTGSWHYKDKAIDVNWAGADEGSKLRNLYHRLKGNESLKELFFDGMGIPLAIGGHDSHLHYAGGGGTRSPLPAFGMGGFGPGINAQINVRGLKKAIAQARKKEGGEANVLDAPKNVTGAIALGKRMAAARGWRGNEWDALYHLWQNESGWRWWADNPTSSAYGIPQSLPGNKMAAAGADWKTNPATQIKWGLDYIAGRPDYGKPSKAWKLWNQREPHWYGQGGIATRPHMGIVGERGREAMIPLDSQTGRSALENAFKGGTDDLASALSQSLREVLSDANGHETINLVLDSEIVSQHQRKTEILRRRR